MIKGNLVLYSLVILALLVFAGWWVQMIIRPGVPAYAKTGMTIGLGVFAAACVVFFFAIRSRRKK